MKLYLLTCWDSEFGCLRISQLCTSAEEAKARASAAREHAYIKDEWKIFQFDGNVVPLNPKPSAPEESDELTDDDTGTLRKV